MFDKASEAALHDLEHCVMQEEKFFPPCSNGPASRCIQTAHFKCFFVFQEEMNRGKPNWEHLSEDLHVLITVEDTHNRAKIKLQRAINEVKKLLVPAVSMRLTSQYQILQTGLMEKLSDWMRVHCVGMHGRGKGIVSPKVCVCVFFCVFVYVCVSPCV